MPLREPEGKKEGGSEAWGAGWDAGLTEWPQVWIECNRIFPIRLSQRFSRSE